MKDFLRIYVFSLLVVLSIMGKAQNHGYDCLGTHCYITVFLNSHPVTADGFFKFTINVPPEGAVNVQGPAGAYLSNNLGNTVDLYVRKIHLDLAADGVNTEVPFELLVNKWTTGWGNYNTSGTGAQCYYWIKIMVNYD